MKIISVNEHPEREERDNGDLPSLVEQLKAIEKLAEEKEAEKRLENRKYDFEPSGGYWWTKY